jgi:Pyruvate phosphate dikinase, AMP/ATP-binding domain
MAPRGFVASPTVASSSVAFKTAVAFKTKAETLEALAPVLCSGRVLPQVRFPARDWRSDASAVLAAISAAPWASGQLIVRSSAQNEDSTAGSQAGRYDSVPGVLGAAAMVKAIDTVIESFAGNEGDDDKVFVQPMLERVAMAGVAFSRSQGSGPYFIVNYDDCAGLTGRVTSVIIPNTCGCGETGRRARFRFWFPKEVEVQVLSSAPPYTTSFPQHRTPLGRPLCSWFQ